MERVNGHWFVGNQDFCDLGKRISENTYYKCLMMLRALINFVGIVSTGTLLMTNIKSMGLHIHTRILVKYHLFCTILVAVIYLGMSLFDFVRLSLTHIDPCEYLMSRLVSFSFHFALANIIFCQILSFLLLTVERLICTFKYRTYEHADYKWRLRICLACMTAAVNYTAYLLIATNANWNITPFYLSFRDSNNFYYTASFILSMFCSDVVTCILIVIVNILNRRRRRLSISDPCVQRNDGQLSSKLQFKQSITLTNTWIPIVILHVVITGISTLVISTIHFVSTIYRGNILMSLPITETCSMFPIYAVMMPIMLFRKHPMLFWKLAEKLTKRRLRARHASAKTPEPHFDKHFELFDRLLHQTLNEKGKK